MTDNDIRRKAILLLDAVRTELALGTKHYDKNGKLLSTDKEIIECMLTEGGVNIEPAEERKHIFDKGESR